MLRTYYAGASTTSPNRLSCEALLGGCNVYTLLTCALQMARPMDTGWLLLAASLPGREAGTARVRLWRALKDAGAVNLRDGVTLIPATPATRKRLGEIAKGIEASSGTSWTFEVANQSPAVEKKLKRLFDRSELYHALAPAIAKLRREIVTYDEAQARSRLREIEQDFRAIAELDFFPGTQRKRSMDSVKKLQASIDARFSPEEPSSFAGKVPRLSRRDFEGALWATRKRAWVDRVASAWLIKRFIDPRARFEWLAKPNDCPKGAHGFDFDGAEFTHVDDLVTFEVLMTAFGLDDDSGLSGIARLVHYLDVGGREAVAEAPGFEAMLAGFRDNCPNDDALLAAVTPVLDAFYQRFAHAHD
jgi:hypothetical protein